ncbi:MAG TPA: SIMPL domain-containing protein [Blastocatellia bacterium]|nr:SIMPL domain-containing protein [Blastocatellia bacterium]
MKRLQFVAVFLLTIPAISNAQEVDKLPAITVTGTAEVQLAPDEVAFSLDVVKTNKDLQAAKRDNDESVAKVLELTRRFNVAPQNVQTTHISVAMKYESVRGAKTRIYNEDGDEIGKRIFKGYEVSKTVVVRLTDISRFEEFFGEVLKTGITTVDSVSFETSKLRENRDKARDMAMRAAKEKATAMAASIGQVIGKALKVTEASTGGSLNTYRVSANATAPQGSFSEGLVTFAPGAIKVEAQVTVSFQLN